MSKIYGKTLQVGDKALSSAGDIFTEIATVLQTANPSEQKKMIAQMQEMMQVISSGDINAWIDVQYKHGNLRMFKGPHGFGDINSALRVVAGMAHPSPKFNVDSIVQAYASNILSAQTPLFFLDKTLGEALLNSSTLENCGELKFPHPTFAIALPKDFLVNGGGLAVDMLVIGKGTVKSHLTEEFIPGVFGFALSLKEYSVQHFSFSFAEGYQDNEVELHSRFLSNEAKEKDFSNRLNSFVLKLLLWFNTRQEPFPENTSLRKIKKYRNIGKSIDLWSANIIGKNYTVKTKDEDNILSRAPKRMHLVRGHFHLYRIGAGRTESKINWVEPYWKCVDRLSLTNSTESPT